MQLQDLKYRVSEGTIQWNRELQHIRIQRIVAFLFRVTPQIQRLIALLNCMPVGEHADLDYCMFHMPV